MDTAKRREELLGKLKESNEPIPGRSLAEVFSVSRQVIVQDIALLRAKGEEIQATSRGYIIEETKNQMVEKTIACKHRRGAEDIKKEIETIIKYGGRVKNVIVEHPLYGEIKGLLRIQNQEDLDEFIAEYRRNNVNPLLTLTDGVHLHTIEGLNEDVLKLIEEQLKTKGFLVE